MTVVEHRAVESSNVEKADEYDEKIVQETNYSHDCFWYNIDGAQYVDET